MRDLGDVTAQPQDAENQQEDRGENTDLRRAADSSRAHRPQDEGNRRAGGAADQDRVLPSSAQMGAARSDV